jgi:hypothetical protein
MRGTVAKKIRKETRKFWGEYLERVRELTFWQRFRIAWAILWASNPGEILKEL